MDKIQFSENVKKLRTVRGLTQESLAEKSGLSLRTIQRIEGGNVNPRSETLIMLSNALGVSPAELADWSVSENRSYLALLNLSALSFILFPILGIIMPLILWLSKKDKVRGLDRSASKTINFQITWNIILFLLLIYQVIKTVLAFDQIQLSGDISRQAIYGITNDVLSQYIWLCAYNAVFVILNTVLSACGRKNFWFPSIPFLR